MHMVKWIQDMEFGNRLLIAISDHLFYLTIWNSLPRDFFCNKVPLQQAYKAALGANDVDGTSLLAAVGGGGKEGISGIGGTANILQQQGGILVV
jgi:hypothetical protein